MLFYGGQKADYDISVEKRNLKYTINCVDEDGKYLGILGREGVFSEKVEVTPPEIDGYDCLDDSSEIALDDSDQQVTFTYKRNLDDYEVAYFNNIEKGKALILIFGIGKYNDMSAVDFSINQIKSPADDKNEADNNSKLDSSSSVSGDALNQALPIHKNKAKKLGKVKNLRVVNKKNRKFTAKWKMGLSAENSPICIFNLHCFVYFYCLISQSVLHFLQRLGRLTGERAPPDMVRN